ncbi:hypothetical protein AVEN_227277-1 [Araneus ventricosus]|uniref:Uncharacterized protein n=1 Tax=Araneus ventricosus TaxID=182803 RepID=A0A4Y2MK86_ARAVE|nr:hypothetical protein AVEN_227277-1 [Araneus ventricosus]
MIRQSKYSAWIFRLVGNPNFRPHRSNSDPISALAAGFDVDRSARGSSVLNKWKPESTFRVPTSGGSSAQKQEVLQKLYTPKFIGNFLLIILVYNHDILKIDSF